MAKPVFANNKAELLTKLRLGSMSNEGSQAVLDEAILQVRTAIYSSLGAARVTTIAAEAYDEAATTDAAILRLTAAQVELFGVKARLLRDAPAFFLDAKNDAEEAWNDDDLLRNANTDEDAISYYEDLFSRGLEALESGEEIGSGIKFKTFGPDNNAQKTIGQSITSGKGLRGLWP